MKRPGDRIPDEVFDFNLVVVAHAHVVSVEKDGGWGGDLAKGSSVGVGGESGADVRLSAGSNSGLLVFHRPLQCSQVKGWSRQKCA